MANDVSFQRAEYQKAAPKWDMVRTLCEGEAAVKEAGETYLPNPVVAGTTTESIREAAAVYARYKERALYVNIVGRTRTSLVGAVFRKSPKLTTPPNLEYMGADCDGSGVSIYQQSQAALSEILATGRSGLLVDYPDTGGAASVAETRAGLIRANIVHYNADQIINWQFATVGGKHVLVRLVLAETAEDVDGFAVAAVEQRRELSMIEGAYNVTLWRKNKDKVWEIYAGPMQPKMSTGQSWTQIPFCFIGATNNDANIDHAPLYDLACVNRKHYQLGADWYNALYFAGQPQPAMTGLTEEWRDWIKKEGVVLGSRSILPLPVGGAYQLVTCPADTAIQKEMGDLVGQMVSLGARLIQKGEASKTATQSAGEQEVSHSIVSLAAENVSQAYTAALQFAQGFAGGTGQCSYAMNGDISALTLDAALIAALVGARMSGDIPKSDLIRFFQRLNLIDPAKSVDQVIEEMETAGIDLGG
jgi:hypothetical protein